VSSHIPHPSSVRPTLWARNFRVAFARHLIHSRANVVVDLIRTICDSAGSKGNFGERNEGKRFRAGAWPRGLDDRILSGRSLGDSDGCARSTRSRWHHCSFSFSFRRIWRRRSLIVTRLGSPLSAGPSAITGSSRGRLALRMLELNWKLAHPARLSAPCL